MNSNATEPNSRAIIRKAYEFALNHVGQDKDSGEIWKDYIDFLKGTETQTTWDAQQRMDAIRSAFHRAVVVPLENVEVLWRELDAFETNLNKITVRRTVFAIMKAIKFISRIGEEISWRSLAVIYDC